MKRWAVGYINFFDNDLKVEIIEAPTFIDAIFKHSHISEDDYSYAKSLSIEDMKQEFFDCDAAIDVVEIPQ